MEHIKSNYVSNNFRKVFVNLFSNRMAIDVIMKFGATYYLFLSKDLDQYETRLIIRGRKFGANMFRLCSLITCVRYLLSSMVNTRWMTIMMADPNYLITNQRLFSMIISLAAFTILFINVLFQIHETNHDLFVVDFLVEWKAKRLVPLNERNKKRLILIINIMISYVMKKAFWPLVIFTNLLVMSKSVEAYFDVESGFMLVPSLFFSACMFIWIIQFYCMVCAGGIVWCIPVFYFKYKFKEINQLVRCFVQTGDSMSLMYAISQHHNLTLQVNAMNQIYQYIVFVLYYFGSPALMMLVCVVQIEETIAIAKPIFAFIVLSVYFVVFYLNLISAQISHWASKPRNSLHKYLINNQMPLKIRSRISDFIVRLNASDTGFYCLNIFILNNYTFYQYVAGCAYNYILILNLYKGMN